MISYLQGTVILKKEGFVVLEVNGVGFQVALSKASIENIPEEGSQLKLFTYLDVAERSLKLYGFVNFQERELFEIIRNISGVGPKAALEISVEGSLEKIKAKLGKGGNIFKGVPGIGPKKAQKIVLELTGIIQASQGKAKKASASSDDEVFSALSRLGFQKEQINQAIEQLPKAIKSTEEKIKKALQILGK